MKNFFSLLTICLLTFVYSLHATAAGGAVYVGDDSPETLFTGSVSSHYLVLSSAGVVSAWGENTYGQCGTEPCDTYTDINYIDFESKITKVVAGNGFSMALDENNTAWGWGNNRNFQLGIRIPNDTLGIPTYFTTPQKVSKNIKDIAVGENFSVLLTTNGDVLLSGKGQSNTLKKINPDNTSFKYVTANYDNIVAVDEDDTIIHWKSDGNIFDVIEIEEVDSVQTVIVGKQHIIIRCLNGENIEFYGFGDNSQSQLGLMELYEATEPVLVLSIPHEPNQHIAEFAGAYSTVVNVWGNMSFADEVTQYRWGTFYSAQINSDAFEEVVYVVPDETAAEYQMIAMGDDNNIAFDYYNNAVILFDGTQTKEIIPIIEPVDEMQNMYEYQYENTDYHTYNVNFIKLDEDKFYVGNNDEQYLHWEYVSENQFRVKVKEFINGYGESSYFSTISTITLSKDITGENRTVGTYGPSVWNFDYKNVLFKSEPLEINQGTEDSTEFVVSAFEMKRREECPLIIPFDVPLFYEAPGKINENTKIGLYLYGLPYGMSGEISDIHDNSFKVSLHRISNCDMDYDSKIKICYIHSDSKESGAVVGDYNLGEVFVSASEKNIKNVIIKSHENTPEILTVSGSLTKGKENGKTIKVSLVGGIFTKNLSPQSWSVIGVDGVGVKAVERIDDNNVILTLSGNSKDKYTNAQLSVKCDSSQYSDSRVYDNDSDEFADADLIANNTIDVNKQNKSSGVYAAATTYTVSFETDGGSGISKQNVNKNAAVKEPETPKKDGYVFGGWYVDKELTKEFDFTSKVVGNITLYAKWDLQDDSVNKMMFTIGKTKAKIFGKEKENDVAPIIKGDRAFLPARFVAESLGAVVEWNAEKHTVTVTKDDTTIIITIGEETAIVNGERIKLDYPAFIENDRTYTPIRFVAENLGCDVEWDDTDRVISIMQYNKYKGQFGNGAVSVTFIVK